MYPHFSVNKQQKQRQKQQQQQQQEQQEQKQLRVVGIEILIPEPEVGIDHNWVAGFGFSEVGFGRNSEFGF